MQLPLQISPRGFALSDAAKSDIPAKAANLDRYYDGIIGCRVVVDGPVKHHRTGPFTISIDLSVPGARDAAFLHPLSQA